MGKGQDLYKKAKTMIPGGTSLLSKRPEMFLPENWPSYFSKSKGCKVWDLDGREYTDCCIMGIGTNTLGYGNEAVDEAVSKVIRDGNMSTFIGRFIPGIRQLISIPAGLSRMHFGAFLFYTFIGAFAWNCVLALLGYIANGQMDMIKEYSHELSVAILVLLVLIVLFYVGRKLINHKA